jgi:hypothetical protein
MSCTKSSISKDERILQYTRYMEFAKTKGRSSSEPSAEQQVTVCSKELIASTPSWKSTRSRWADCEDEETDSEPDFKALSSEGVHHLKGESSGCACASEGGSDVRKRKDPERFWSTSTTISSSQSVTNDSASESGERIAHVNILPPYRQIAMEDELHFQQVEMQQLEQQRLHLEQQLQELEKKPQRLFQQELEQEDLMNKRQVRLSQLLQTEVPSTSSLKSLRQKDHTQQQDHTRQPIFVPPGIWNVPRTICAFGYMHRFHPKAALNGLAPDLRSFTKLQSKGRLSIISENQVRYDGIHRYMVQFTAGELSNADGVGLIFSDELPCPKNIQRIISVFVNRTGRICIRAHADVERCDMSVKSLELGDWLEVVSNLHNRTITFSVWPRTGGPCSTATINFGCTFDLIRLTSSYIPRNPCGYLAAVVKHVGVTVTLGS